MLPRGFRLLLVTLAGVSNGFPQKPLLLPSGVQNAGSLIATSTVTPQMLVTLRGQSLAPGAIPASGYPLPVTLGGTSATVNGIAMPLLYVSPTQIDAQVPTNLIAGQAASIVVTTPAGSSDPVQAMVAFSSGGIFTQDASGCGPGVVFNVHPDGSVSMNTPRDSYDPASDVALTIFLTGLSSFFGDRQDGIPYSFNPADNRPLNVTAFLGVPGIQSSSTMQVIYAGPAPTKVGVDQVNAKPNPTLLFEGCSVPLLLTDGLAASASQLVNLSIHKGGGACVNPPLSSLALVNWQKNARSDAASFSSSEGIQAKFLRGNHLVFPPAPLNAAIGSSVTLVCCSAEPNPPLNCQASLPDSIGAGELTVSGVTAKPLTLAPDASSFYQASLPVGTLEGGNYQISSAGGTVVGAFTTAIDVAAPVIVTTALSPNTALTLPLKVGWTGGDERSVIQVKFIVTSPLIGPPPFELSVTASGAAGSIDLPASVFIPFSGFVQVPAGDVEIVVIQQTAGSAIQNFAAPGLTLGGQQTWTYTWDFHGLKH